MLIFVCATIPQSPDAQARHCEIKQNSGAAPQTTHPQTSEPVRRAVPDGLGVLSSGKAGGGADASGTSCCGPSRGGY